MKRFVLMVIIIPFVFACGSTSDGKSGSSFESVRVYVSGSSVEGMPVYEADSVNKGDGSCDNVSKYTFTHDDIVVSVRSEALPNLPPDMELADVEVYKITVSFTPNDNESPEVLPKEFYPVNYIIEPDSTLDITVRIIDREEKVDPNSPFYYYYNFGREYSYTVNISFEAEEYIYGDTHSFSYSFQLRYLDVEDDCT